MNYTNTIKWEIIPLETPKVKKSCPKCGKGASYKNSEKFRVNANKRNLDVWLIYQCEKCKSTWNMSIYERINPQDIEKDLLLGFTNNDRELAKAYGFDLAIHDKNKATLDMGNVAYEIKGTELNVEDFIKPMEGHMKIFIECQYPMGVRVGKVLSKKLGLSRKRVKEIYRDGGIYDSLDRDILKQKINGKTEIYIKSLVIQNQKQDLQLSPEEELQEGMQ